MAKKRKTKKSKNTTAADTVKALFSAENYHHWRRLGKVFALLVVLGAAAVGLHYLEGYVQASAQQRDIAYQIAWSDMPQWATDELVESINLSMGIQAEDSILDEQLPRQWAANLAANPWVKSVRQLYRRYDGVIELDLELREPVAAVFQSGQLSYVDLDGVVLPEMPVQAHLVRIQGAVRALPDPGEQMDAPDLMAGLEVLEMIRLVDEELPGRDRLWTELVVMDVGNYEGRQNSSASHLTMYTLDNTEVRWGAAVNRSVPYREANWRHKLSKLYRKRNKYGSLTGFEYIELRDRRDDLADLPRTNIPAQ